MTWVFFKVPTADCDLKSVCLIEWREVNEEQQTAAEQKLTTLSELGWVLENHESEHCSALVGIRTA